MTPGLWLAWRCTSGCGMTSWAGPVLALYAELGGWQEVSDACAVNGHAYSPGCFWNIAEGKTRRPTLAVRKAILAGLVRTPGCASLAVNASLARDGRATVHIYHDDRAAGNLERERISATWPQMVHLWRLAYDEKEMRG